MTTRLAQLQDDTNFRVLRMRQANLYLTQREIEQQLGISTSGLKTLKRLGQGAQL
jgi:hypothetical protein